VNTGEKIEGVNREAKELGEVFTGKADSGKLYIIFCNHSDTPLKFISSRQKK